MRDTKSILTLFFHLIRTNYKIKQSQISGYRNHIVLISQSENLLVQLLVI